MIYLPDDNQTLGDQLRNFEEQLFIDRPQELELFQQALHGAPRHWHILNIYGPGGIGKSTLLDGYRRLSEQHGTPYLYFDASDFDAHPARFVQRCATLLQLDEQSLAAVLETLTDLTKNGMVVIAIDTYEDTGELNRWLRENFFAHLPKRCLMVIAGRYPLFELWKNHTAWQRLIESVPLTNFTHGQSIEYLRNNGITQPALIEAAWRNTGGYPLALSLSVMLAARDGPTAMREFANNPNIVATLTERWLREIDNPKLRTLIEAAAISRFFNQDILSAIAGESITDQEFRQLLSSSLIRRRTHGWAITSMVRLALVNELNHRTPERYQMLRFRALHVLAQLAINVHSTLDRSAAVQEFFYVLGDSLIRAAHYHDEIDPRPDLHIEGAVPHDIPALEAYMDEWRRERGMLASTQVELFDRSISRTIPQLVIAEPREPEFINISELIEKFPGSIRMLEDNSNTLHGLTIVLPINSASLEYLRQQPVTGSYFQSLDEEQLAEYSTAPHQTNNWFVRLIDTRNPSDNSARAVLFRDLSTLLIRPARFITSTPLEMYQVLLNSFGFKKLETPPHHDFGKDRPAPYFVLDLRGENLALYLHSMIKLHMGDGAKLPFESLLAATSDNKENVAASRQLLLEKLSQREQEVALLASEGLPNCTIAARLDVSEVTVKKHMGNIFDKLGVRNRHELIKKFLT